MRRKLQRSTVDPELLQHLPRVPVSKNTVGGKIVIDLDKMRGRRRRLPCSRNSRLRIADDAVFDIDVAGANPRRQRQDDRGRIAAWIRQQRSRCLISSACNSGNRKLLSRLASPPLPSSLRSRTPCDYLRASAATRRSDRSRGNPARWLPVPARARTRAAWRRRPRSTPASFIRCHEKLSNGKPPLPASCG